MTEWIDVCKEQDFANHDRKIVELDDTDVIVFRVNNDFYAIDHLCTHAEYELNDAEVDFKDCSITCPLHDAKFCIKTGKALSLPAFENLPKYAVRNHDGMIQVSSEAEG